MKREESINLGGRETSPKSSQSKIDYGREMEKKQEKLWTLGNTGKTSLSSVRGFHTKRKKENIPTTVESRINQNRNQFINLYLRFGREEKVAKQLRGC